MIELDFFLLLSFLGYGIVLTIRSAIREYRLRHVIDRMRSALRGDNAPPCPCEVCEEECNRWCSCICHDCRADFLERTRRAAAELDP